MIERIYFKDGYVSYEETPNERIYTLDLSKFSFSGYSLLKTIVDDAHKERDKYYVYFNIPFWFDYLKDFVSLDSIFIYDFVKKEYRQLQDVTEKDLSDYNKKNLCKLFTGHNFDKNCYQLR